MRRLPSGAFGIDIRRRDIRRLALSLDTDVRAVARERAAYIEHLITAREFDILDRLRQRTLSWREIDDAMRPGGAGLDTLRELRAPSIAEARTAFLADLATLSTAIGTIYQYRAIFNTLERSFRNRTLDSITEDEARRFLRRRTWSAKTQSSRHSQLARIWAFSGIVDHIWLRVRPSPARVDTVPTWLTLTETYDFLRQLPLSSRVFMACGYLATLRSGEAQHLRWVDLDLDAALLFVRPRSGPYAWKPKHDNSIRSVTLPPSFVDWLRQWQRESLNGSYVFRGANPLDSNTAYRWAAKAYASASLIGFTYHDGRHSAISNGLRAGLPPAQVAAAAGIDMRTMFRYYAHILNTDSHALGRALAIENASASPAPLRQVR